MARERTSSGVQALIDRLRDEGVEAGRKEAERIVAEAHERAAQIVEEARAEAKAQRTQAAAEIEAERKAAQEALSIAARDTVLDLRGEMSQRFAAQIRRLVGRELRDPEFLQRLILEVAGRALPEGRDKARMEILLPSEVIGVEELRRRPEEVEHGTLTDFVLATSRELLEDGIEITSSTEHEAGIRFRLVEQDVEIDLTEKAVAALLLRHLLPRFRALLEGIVR